MFITSSSHLTLPSMHNHFTLSPDLFSPSLLAVDFEQPIPKLLPSALFLFALY
ncbi:hypothetical protein FORC9_4268 [Vibrio vulnificus]|nr:hypothetical protein FORC9_4268 [Vibrio vulnificus]ANH66149.1 hypothetical protein FORC16_4266 [Vibrio vulnificus]